MRGARTGRVSEGAESRFSRESAGLGSLFENRPGPKDLSFHKFEEREHAEDTRSGIISFSFLFFSVFCSVLNADVKIRSFRLVFSDF